MSNPLTDILVSLEEREIESLARGWLDNEVKTKAVDLSASQEAVLVAASPILVNMLAELVLKKAAAGAPAGLPPPDEG